MDAQTPSATRPLSSTSPNTPHPGPTRLNLTSPPTQPRDPLSPATPVRMGSHRQSMSENLRGVPQSPRSRHTSVSQFQVLLDDPPLPHNVKSPFEGRDWKEIQVGEVVDPTELHWSTWDTSVEDATKLLVDSGPPNVVLIREHEQSLKAVATFDYSDLNAYLLLVVGLSHAQADASHVASFNELANKGRSGEPIPLRDIGEIGRREPLVTLPHTTTIPQALDIFGSGVHRIVIKRADNEDAVGVLSQLRLVRFFWEFGRSFPGIEPLFHESLKDLGIGLRQVKNINGDKPLTDALELMDRESITSIPVLDNANNVMGNLSTVDVRLLTKSTSLPLLRSSCIHFISVILSERGMDDGKDSFPVFHVQHQNTLAATVAKLVATRSHRMWIVDPFSSSGNNASIPIVTGAHNSIVPPASMNPQHNGPPYTGGLGSSATAITGRNMSGRLTGVVSLTDVLNLLARANGLVPRDPEEARRLRRRSSSSSVRSRPSTDFARSSTDLSRGGASSTSISGRER